MSSMCSSWRRRSPARARASSGSKPSMVMVVRNMCLSRLGKGEKWGRELYRNVRAAALLRAAAAAEASRQRGPEAAPAGLDEVLHDLVPGLGQILAVVAPAPQGQHPPVTAPLCQRREVAGGMPVGAGGEAQVGDGIALQAVGAALQDHEFGVEFLKVRHDARPDTFEDLIIRTRGQGQVELHAARSPGTDLLRSARARIKIATILVHVGEHHRRIVLESVEHAVAVVGVDVDVGDALETGTLEQLDGDPAVVEDAETRRVIARGTMESG